VPDEMASSQRVVYDATAAAAMLITHLHQEGALTITEQAAAAKSIQLYDNLSERGFWPEDWREYAHVELIDLASD
jgi:hypothetical protein